MERFANLASTTLAATINDGQTTIAVASAALFPTLPQFRILIGSELMIVTHVSGTTWTVTRATEGTAAEPSSRGGRGPCFNG